MENKEFKLKRKNTSPDGTVGSSVSDTAKPKSNRTRTLLFGGLGLVGLGLVAALFWFSFYNNAQNGKSLNTVENQSLSDDEINKSNIDGGMTGTTPADSSTLSQDINSGSTSQNSSNDERNSQIENEKVAINSSSKVAERTNIAAQTSNKNKLALNLEDKKNAIAASNGIGDVVSSKIKPFNLKDVDVILTDGVYNSENLAFDFAGKFNSVADSILMANSLILGSGDSSAMALSGEFVIAYFDKASYKMNRAEHETLKAILPQLNADPSKKIYVLGFASSEGSLYFNNIISLARAKMAQKLLNTYGIEPNRVVYLGMGILRPIGNNNSEEGRSKNRRASVLIPK